MKKILLAVIISIFLLSSCNETVPADSEESGRESEEIQLDMDGYNCKILQHGYTGTSEGDVFYYKQDTLLYDLALKRIEETESLYNCSIEYEFFSFEEPFVQYITNNIASGINDGEIATSIALESTYKLVSGDCLYPLTELKHIIDYENMEKFGSAGQLETAMKNGVPYAVTGAMLPLKQCLSGLPISVFNTSLIQQYGLGDPREFHEKNNWTWDTFETFLRDYTVSEGEKKIYAAEFTSFVFVDGAMRSNGVEYVKKEGALLVSGIDSENTLGALDWVKKIYTEYADNILYNNISWANMNNDLKNGNTMLVFTEAIEMRDTIAYNVESFGILPFPCGPLGTYGKNSSSAAMEAIGILANAEEPEYAAHIINKLLDPFEEYRGTEGLKKFYETIFHDSRDIELYFNIDKYSSHAYYPVGGYDFATKAANSILSKSSAEIIKQFAPAYNLIIEKYIMPNYELVSYLKSLA